MRPKSNFHLKFKLLYLLLRHKIKHLMCKCCCSHSRPRFCSYSSFVNVWSHPKEAINLFLNWKKPVFHIKTEQYKKCYNKTEKTAILNSHAYFSFFVSFHLYMIYGFGFSLPALLYLVSFTWYIIYNQVKLIILKIPFFFFFAVHVYYFVAIIIISYT